MKPKDLTRQGSANSVDETSIRMEITEAVLMAGVMAFSDYNERRKRGVALSKFDMMADI